MVRGKCHAVILHLSDLEYVTEKEIESRSLFSSNVNTSNKYCSDNGQYYGYAELLDGIESDKKKKKAIAKSKRRKKKKKNKK